jgi:hypothetical protein
MRIVLVTYNAEKIISMVEKNLVEDAKLQKIVRNTMDFQEFSNLVENLRGPFTMSADCNCGNLERVNECSRFKDC